MGQAPGAGVNRQMSIVETCCASTPAICKVPFEVVSLIVIIAIVQTVTSAVGAHGEALVRALLVSAAGTCPNHLLRILSGCLYGLITSPTYRHAVASILPA
eukprot:scaffold204652_cov41-Prasinocladus_malaysianus.AAC.1